MNDITMEAIEVEEPVGAPGRGKKTSTALPAAVVTMEVDEEDMMNG
jgi:hypothetical protein